MRLCSVQVRFLPYSPRVLYERKLNSLLSINEKVGFSLWGNIFQSEGKRKRVADLYGIYHMFCSQFIYFAGLLKWKAKSETLVESLLNVKVCRLLE